MPSKSQVIIASFFLFYVIWSSTSLAKAQSEELKRPTRPDSFNSPEQVAQYVNDMKEYLRAKTIRYGKRVAPRPSMDDIETVDMINAINKQQMENTDADGIGAADFFEEENPQEQLALQQARALKNINWLRILAQIPLPLVKYMQIIQNIDQYEGESDHVGNKNIPRSMLHPFVRQRFISTKPKVKDF